VQSADGFIVVKIADVPVLGEFDMESSRMATKRVDLNPYFGISRPGRYHVTATLRIKDWNQEVASPVKSFDVISGITLWSQDFGVPPPAGVTNSAPEIRKYTLEKADLEDPKFQNSPLRLYVQVSDETESRVFKVAPVGKMVSFSHPDTQVDRFSNLHVLWQSGASIFTYAVVNPDGVLLRQEIYDYVTARPRLGMNSNGDVVVAGGALRVRPAELPVLKMPQESPAPVKP
jgi:hypothetical protein